MNSIIESSFQIPEKLLGVYKKMEISPIGILNSYALDLISNKIQKYELENNLFEKNMVALLIFLKRRPKVWKTKKTLNGRMI